MLKSSSTGAGVVPANGACARSRAIIARSSASHANPTPTCSATVTSPGPRAASAWASSTALSRPPEKRTALYFVDMYLVTKRIAFCYGHGLIDYDGVCNHLHDHHDAAEIA